jgi:hypothetical protein
MEDFIRQFTGSGSAGNDDPLKRVHLLSLRRRHLVEFEK